MAEEKDVKKMTVVKKAIADLAHEKNFNIAGDAYEAIDDKVKSIIERAMSISGANGRKTVSKKDIEFL